MTKNFCFIIKIYKYFISPLLGNRCRFFYLLALSILLKLLNTHGLIEGFKLGVKRILKCHPFKKIGQGDSNLNFKKNSDFKKMERKTIKMDRNVFVAIALSMSVLLFLGLFF